MEDTKQFASTMEKFSEMMTWIQEKAKQAGCTFSEMHKIELAMEEALVNIIRYAYPKEPGMIEIACKIQPKQSIEFVIIDGGIPFDPVGFAAQFDANAVLEARLEGGLGITIIKESVDTVKYVRGASTNILTLKKMIGPKKTN